MGLRDWLRGQERPEPPSPDRREWLRKRAQPENGGLSAADMLSAAQRANLPVERPGVAPRAFRLETEGVVACAKCGAPLDPPGTVCACGPFGMEAQRGIIVRRKAV